MARQIKISTTGTQSPVTIDDLGGRQFTHPTVDFDLATEYSYADIVESADLQALIDAGHVTVKDQNSVAVTNLEDSGGADMTKAKYDANGDDVADDAEKLNNQSASYYLDVDNHTDGTTKQGLYCNRKDKAW